VSTASKVGLSLVLVLFLLLAFSRYYVAETIAFAWHLRHGVHADLRQYRFKVPWLYYADDPDGLPVLSISKLPGHTRPGMALITVKMGEQDPLDEIHTSTSEKGDLSLRIQKMEERNASLAEHSGTCVEYITETSNNTSGKALLRDFNIRCVFGNDLGAEFLGSPKLKSDFYEMLRTAEHRKGTS
jgi:hypothetical protein